MQWFDGHLHWRKDDFVSPYHIAWKDTCCCSDCETYTRHGDCEDYHSNIDNAGCIVLPGSVKTGDLCDFADYLQGFDLELRLPGPELWTGDGCEAGEDSKPCTDFDDRVITLSWNLIAFAFGTIDYIFEEDWCGPSGFDITYHITINCASVFLPPNRFDPDFYEGCVIQVQMAALDIGHTQRIHYIWELAIPNKVDLGGITGMNEIEVPMVQLENNFVGGAPHCWMDVPHPVYVKTAGL